MINIRKITIANTIAMKFLQEIGYLSTRNRKSIFNVEKTIRFTLIPLLGVFIPNLTGLISNGAYSLPMLLVNYSCFIILYWLVWEGDLKLTLSFKNQFKILHQEYYKRHLLHLITVIAYSTVISASILLTWHYFSNENKLLLQPVVWAVALVSLSAIFITNIYENFFLFKERAVLLREAEQLRVEKTNAQLLALTSQIDAHFIFNSLNTLSFLISTNPADARLYNDTLSKVYQYILVNRDKNIVPLKDELDFVNNYFNLLKVRFGSALKMSMQISDSQMKNIFILPISLQILLENIVKHNDLSEKKLSSIYITVSPDYLIVKNEVNLKKYRSESTKIGLTNLDNRYRLITGKNIIINRDSQFFEVRLPLVTARV